LFYRINVLSIAVPPLRERKEDIPLLIDHFIARNNARFGTNIRGVDADGRRLLMEYSWPGNVRELENVIERAMVLAEKETIGVDDLPERIRDARSDQASPDERGAVDQEDVAGDRGDLDPPRAPEDEGEPDARGRGARD
jgi:transcriptional regulator with PAS, ATPase and Fis domain